jgi:diguanylate cyclase (GGDEF)-like protein
MVRKNISRHHASVSRFKQRVGALDTEEQAAAWKELCREAEAMLAPTLQLANQIAGAYDQIHQEGNPRLTFNEDRTDSLTGVGNRRGLDETLDGELAMMDRYANGFSVAIFDVDHLSRVNDREGRAEGDRLLARIARLLEEYVRQTDVVARYGGEQFAVVMRETDLDGGRVFAERLRLHVEEKLPATVSGGVTTALDGDTTATLLSRADAAMTSAKSAGRNCVFLHTGEGIEAVSEGVLV